MKKRPAVAAKTKAEPTTARFESIPEHQTNEASRMASGFDSTNWHAAIRLQVAVRDAIRRPVTLEQALVYAKAVFEQTIEHYGLEMLQKRFDAQQESERREKDAEQKRIAATAGQR